MLDNIGFGELLVIALFILIFFGPKKIPDIARSLGKAIREFRKAMQDVQSEIQSVTGFDLNSDSNFTVSKNDIEVESVKFDDLKFEKEKTQAVLTTDDSKSKQRKETKKKKKKANKYNQRKNARVKTKLKKR